MNKLGFRPRPKPRTCCHIKDDGSKCGAFANASGKCPSHAGSPGTLLRGWDRDNPYREGWTGPAWDRVGGRRARK